MTHTWPDVLSDLIAGRDLDAATATWAMGEILSGDATGAQIAGFAVALRAKGETAAELRGLVDAMYAKATTLDLPDLAARAGRGRGRRSRGARASRCNAAAARPRGRAGR